MQFCAFTNLPTWKLAILLVREKQPDRQTDRQTNRLKTLIRPFFVPNITNKNSALRCYRDHCRPPH